MPSIGNQQPPEHFVQFCRGCQNHVLKCSSGYWNGGECLQSHACKMLRPACAVQLQRTGAATWDLLRAQEAHKDTQAAQKSEANKHLSSRCVSISTVARCAAYVAAHSLVCVTVLASRARAGVSGFAGTKRSIWLHEPCSRPRRLWPCCSASSDRGRGGESTPCPVAQHSQSKRRYR